MDYGRTGGYICSVVSYTSNSPIKYMIVIRRRLIYWLIKEYIRKWKKAIFFSFLIGLGVFFGFIFILRYFTAKIPVGKTETIGVVGAYSLQTLPPFILQDITKGLTVIAQDGSVLPGVAREWKVDETGKQYTFFLRNDVAFSDGKSLTSNDVSYSFSNVKVTRPNKQTIVFTLKDSYSPFLVSASHPIFKKGFVGIGQYFIRDVKLNGNFVQTIILALTANPYQTKIYQFYPSIDALKTAYMLGEVSRMVGLPDIEYKNSSFDTFQNTKIKKVTDYDQLVTIFYNTTDSVPSDKRLRSALSYSLPDTFSSGEKARSPISLKSWAYAQNFALEQDIDQAKILLEAYETGTKSANLRFELKTLPKYKDTAEEVAKAWEAIGVKTDIVVVESVPTTFQAFLGNFFLPKDPDQYTLWHSAQANNITRYDSKRIDKLLEDGRKITDRDERKKIYADFQKYLLADSPASFLYFPYAYEVSRK